MSLEYANNYSRVRANEQKMGAYYTDLEHCRDIGKLLRFPTDEEVSVLEPSIGDASAVIAVTGATTNSNIRIFGVELETKVYQDCKKNPILEEVINADFTDGVFIRRNAFSFCFGNPPYMEGDDSGKRMEKIFLEKCTNYLKVGGVLVWVIPHRVFVEETYLRYWMRNYDTEAIYRFRDSEYQKWHQIVIIGRKVSLRDLPVGELAAFQAKISPVDKLEVLPSNGQPTIVVNPSPSEGVDLFAPRKFDGTEFYSSLSHGFPDDINRAFKKLITPKEYSVGVAGNPPIPPKKDHLYLMAMSGCGQGLTGSLETKDLHLQRGVAEVVEHVDYGEEDIEDDSDSSGKIVVTSSTQVMLTIIENSGKITTLK